MIGTIRKHSKWLWGVIIVVTIITFVFWGSQSASHDGGQASLGSINGRPVTREQYLAAQHEIELYYFFNNGVWPDQDARRTGFDVERETYFRLLLIKKIKELNIEISDESVATLGAQMLRQFNRGNPVPLDAFVQQVLQPRGMGAGDFARFIRNDLGIQQLASTVGASGQLVPPQEIREIYAREHQALSVQPVFISVSNYLSSVTVTPEAFSRFYTNQMARYHLPERVQVNYVVFAASNYMAEATQELTQLTNLSELIDACYERMGTNFFKEAKTPAEAKAKIKQLMLEKQALMVARKQANDFARELYDLQPAKVGNLAKLAAEKKLTLHLSEPFSREEPPTGLRVPETFVKAAFTLNESEPVADLQMTDDAVYQIEFSRRLPAENPPLEQVRAQVTADCKYYLARLQAHAAGAAFYSQATNSLAKGKSFAQACKDAGMSPAETVSLSLSTRSLPEVDEHVNLNEFKQAVFSTPPGELSSFMPSGRGGFLVFVQARLPLDAARMQTELPEFAAAVRQNRKGEVFNQWFRHEIDVSLRNTPIMQKQKTAPPGPGTPE